jgi:prepilin-type N-terminal cleavage/methylation domain-containing protein
MLERRSSVQGAFALRQRLACSRRLGGSIMRKATGLVASCRKAFTLVEVLVVAVVIAVLLGLLLPALTGAWNTGNMAKSQSRLKQIATWMQSYASENRDTVVPSQFDYTASAAAYPVKVRSDADLPGTERYRGTWTDILWTYGGLGAKTQLVDDSQTANLDKYVFDSPDRAAYEHDPDYDANPFRSSAANTKDFANGDGTPLPFGLGALESGVAGFFAANNFFNVDPDANPATPQVWYTTGQIKAPDRSMYVVDSFAGETIEPDGAVGGPWDNPSFDGGGAAVNPNFQVDFRYNGAGLMLFLDGHSGAEGPWRNLGELQSARRIKVQNLTQN